MKQLNHIIPLRHPKFGSLAKIVSSLKLFDLPRKRTYLIEIVFMSYESFLSIFVKGTNN